MKNYFNKLILVFYMSLAFMLFGSFSTSKPSRGRCSSLPDIYLFFGLHDNSSNYRYDLTKYPFLKDQCIKGAQVLYTWKALEPKKDQYDFSNIQGDLNYLQSIGKQLWIQIQDRSFIRSENPVPDYILTDQVYKGGATPQNDNGHIGGWIANVWDKNVRKRFQKLMMKLAEEFD